MNGLLTWHIEQGKATHDIKFGGALMHVKDRFNFPVRAIFDDPKGFRLEQAVVSLNAH